MRKQDFDIQKEAFERKLKGLNNPKYLRESFILSAWLCCGKTDDQIGKELGKDGRTINRSANGFAEEYFGTSTRSNLIHLFLLYAPQFVHADILARYPDAISKDIAENRKDIDKLIGKEKLWKNLSSSVDIDKKTDDEIGNEFGGANSQFYDNLPSEMRTIIEGKLNDKFIGRKFVFEAFNRFKESNRNGYFTIIAEPGMGKSTIAAQYVAEQSWNDDVDCVCFFIVSGASDRPEACIRSICEQLSSVYKLGVDISRIAQGQDVITTVLLEILQEVREHHLNSRKLVIVIDALDELASYGSSRGNICYLPRHLPENVYFLLTRRNFIAEDERLRVDTAGKQNFKLISYMEECKADIREYIEYQLASDRYREALKEWIANQNVSESDFIKVLEQKSQANFMYLRYVIPAIAEGIYQNINLSEIANGLREYYEDHWRIMDISAGFGISVIAVFIVAEEKTSINFIAQVLNLSIEQVKETVKKCIQFLDSSQLSSNFNILIQQDTYYRFYHKDYQDYLKEMKMNDRVLAATRTALIVEVENDSLADWFNS